MKNGQLRSFVNFVGWCAAVVSLGALAATGAAWTTYRNYERRAAKFDLTKIDDLPERSEVYDANGELYSYLGGENRVVIPLASVSKNFINALLAREDSRFWEHHGVDPQGVARAFLTNLRAGETKQGASTITQQLARNALELHERSLDRKILEAVLARHIEQTFSKEQILELYVNRIYFGAGCYGIEAASRRYFGKPAADLTLSEGATLAAVIRSPQRLAPTRNLHAAMSERDVVLDRMVELNLITSDESTVAKAQQLQVAKRAGNHIVDDDIMDAVMRELGTVLAPEKIDFGGLRVFMTIDPSIQRLAQEAADRKLTEIEAQKNYPHPRKKDFQPAPADAEKEKPTDYLQSAVVVVENKTGAIRAIVGARDYEQSKYSRALLSERQIGSTFKPFVYASAFEHGMLPGTLIDDSKIEPGEFRDLPKKWSPANSDNDYGGPQPAAIGLIKSRNTMSVRVGEYAGLPKVRDVARSVGLGDHVPNLPVVFLGGFETTARNLTSAYTVFPNLGVYRPSYLISSIEDREGRVLWHAAHDEKRVIAPDSAWMITGILQQVMKTGTAAKAASLGWKKIGAGKTGTTNDFFDAWFVGYTSSLTCGVWVGMDHPQTILEKGYGSALALPIWVEIMQHIPEKQYPAGPFTAPEQTLKVKLCSVSGARATSGCASQGTVYDAELPVSRIPREMCRTHPEPIAPTQPLLGSPVASLPPASAPQAQPQPTQVAPAPSAAPLTQLTPAPTPPPLAARSAPIASQPPVQTAPLPPIGERSSGELRMESTPDGERIVHWPSRPASDPFPGVEPTTRVAPASRALPPELGRVEVRRAVPVQRPSRDGDSAETATSDGSGERRIVERLPDGRVRTTIIRSVRRPVDRDSGLFHRRLFSSDD